MKKLKSLLLPIYIILNIIYIFITGYLFTSYKMYYRTIAYSYNIILLINILIIIGLFIYKKIRKEIKFNIVYFLLISTLVFLYISSIFAINHQVALYGASGRYEGLYTICYYFSLFFLSSFVDKKHKNIIVHTIAITCLLMSIYTIFQMTDITSFFEEKKIFTIFRRVHNGRTWATGFTTNPNFLATYLLIGLSYSIGLFIDSKKLIRKIIYLFFIVIIMIALCFSNTLSCLVGLCVVFIYSLIYLIKNKGYRKIIILSFVLIYLLIIMSMLNKTTLLNDFIKMGGETKEIAKGNISESYGTNRMFVWKNTLRIVPKNIITGVGIDNFYYAFGDEPLRLPKKYYFDKVHNEYLQTLICSGIFTLISYLLLYGMVTYRGIKNSFREKSIYLILPIIGYLAQAFFNISVIEVAPIFWIGLGLLIDKKVTL